MISQLSLSTILLLAIPSLILYILATWILIPYVKVMSHKKEHVSAIFYPIAGYFIWIKKSFAKEGDVFAWTKKAIDADKDQKYLVTNSKTKLFYMLRDPQYIKELLQKPNNYEKSEILDTFKPFIGNGLIFSEGSRWKSHRIFLSKNFNYEFLKSNIPLMQETTKELLDNLTQEELENYQVIPKLQDITGEIVGRIFFGRNLSAYTMNGKRLTQALADLLTELATITRSPLSVFLGPKIMNKLPFLKNYHAFLKRSTEFREVCYKIIQDRRAQKEQPQDFLGMLLKSQESDDLKERYNDSDIVDEFITFFVAGMDTTGHLLAMTLYNLQKNPEHLNDLQEEINRLYNNETESTSEALHKMDITYAHLKETLRMHPPAPFIFNRKAIVDHKILDINIKKGEYISPEFVSLMYNSKYFEDPYTYNPQRWNKENATKLDAFAYTPFSAGPRNCIGQHMAIIESKIILGEFLNRFNFKTKEGYQLKMGLKFLYEPIDLVFKLTRKS